MRKGNNKRSFMAPQPAAQIAALDFTHQSEAFRRALAASEAAHQSRDIDAADAACTLAGEIADRLLGIPTTNPAQIAEKVNAFCFANHLSVDLANAADQRRVAESDHDGAKGLLAIYLDLTTQAPAANAELLEEGRNLLALEVAFMEAPMNSEAHETLTGEWVARHDRFVEACAALPATPDNIDAKLMAVRTVHENTDGLADFDTDTTDVRLMRDIIRALLVERGWQRPDWTGPCAWVEAVEKETGCHVRAVGQRLDFSDDGKGGLVEMMAHWEALSPERREIVRAWVVAEAAMLNKGAA